MRIKFSSGSLFCETKSYLANVAIDVEVFFHCYYTNSIGCSFYWRDTFTARSTLWSENSIEKVKWRIKSLLTNRYSKRYSCFITWRSRLLFLTYLWKSLTQYILLSKSMVNGTPSKHSLQTQHRKHPGWYVFPIAWSIWKLFNKCSIDEQKEITFYRFVIWYIWTSLYWIQLYLM